jgi:hypothetical protein
MARTLREPLINVYSWFYDRKRLEAHYGEGLPFLRIALPAALILAGLPLLISSVF